MTYTLSYKVLILRQVFYVLWNISDKEKKIV